MCVCIYICMYVCSVFCVAFCHITLVPCINKSAAVVAWLMLGTLTLPEVSVVVSEVEVCLTL